MELWKKCSYKQIETNKFKKKSGTKLAEGGPVVEGNDLSEQRMRWTGIE